MNQLRFLSREKLVEYLDEELRYFLNHKGIYEIDQYGWLSDNDPDPEYIGLAMWQAEPPAASLSTEHNDGISTTSLCYESVFRNGLEFEGLMKAARHSIGFTYLYHTPDLLEAETYGCFLHHYSDAVMKLDLATERLRELFINSFGSFFAPAHEVVVPGDSLCMDDNHYLYCRPFYETRVKLAEQADHFQELVECFDDLVPLIEQTSFYRLDGLEQNKKLCLSEGSSSLTGRSPGSGSIDADIATRDIAEWYKLLVKTGSQVFLAEYLARNLHKDLPYC